MTYKETLDRTNKILIKYFETHKRIYAIIQLCIGLFLIVFSLYCIAWIIKSILDLFI